MPATTPVADLLARWMADGDWRWSIGTFGALAQFSRQPHERVRLQQTPDALLIASAHGALRLTPTAELRLIAYETVGFGGEGWSSAVALCLPRRASGMSGHHGLTERGFDDEAVHVEDRRARLFDLGLGAPHTDMLVRTSNPALVATLRRHVGRSVFDAGSGAMRAVQQLSPDRIVATRVGRVEVSQAVRGPSGDAGDGPRAYLAPRLLTNGRTHAATTPIPEGWVPCGYAIAPPPIQVAADGSATLDLAAHARFQSVLHAYGMPELVGLKARVRIAVQAGDDPARFAVPSHRYSRATIRIALRQLAEEGAPVDPLIRWLAAFDPLSAFLRGAGRAARLGIAN